MTKFLSTSTEPRDVENDGSRFWATDAPGESFGEATVGIVDENEGGVVLYTHESRAEQIIAAFRAFTGEV